MINAEVYNIGVTFFAFQGYFRFKEISVLWYKLEMELVMFIPTMVLCLVVWLINKSKKTEAVKKKLIARWIGGYVVSVALLFWFVMNSVEKT